MPAILPNYEYDIFISYRQNDNKRDGWVTNFVAALKDELEATLKNPVSIYFDENPHDGLLESHQVNASLEKKLKCLVFIPIISQTYCDTSSFAWEHEFLPFLKMAGEDELGMNITLSNGNVASRVLPVKIHELDNVDLQVLEKKLAGPLRAIDFTYKEPGVNRPLKPEDTKGDILYHNQINKVANALKEIGSALLIAEKAPLPASAKVEQNTPTSSAPDKKSSIKKVLFAVAAVLILLLAYFLYPSSPKISGTHEYDIAVMYLENLTDDPKYGEGLVNLIQINLSEDTSLNLVPRQKLYDELKNLTGDTNAPDRTIATELASAIDAEFMIIGRVIQQKLEVLAQVELVEVATGKLVATKKVQGNKEDIFQLADNITKELMQGRLPERNYDVTRITTGNYKAYQLFYDGMEHLWDLEWGEASIKFEQAIQLDPTFALAYMFKAIATNPFGASDVYQDMNESNTYIQQAFQRSASLPANQQLMVQVMYEFSTQNPNHLNTLNQLLEADPYNRFANIMLPTTLSQRGNDGKKSISLREKYLIKNPEDDGMWNGLAYIYQDYGQYDKAVEAVDKYRELRPNLYNAIHSSWEINLMAGNFGKAVMYAEQLERNFDSNKNRGVWRGITNLVMGNAQDALDTYQLYRDSTDYRGLQSLGFDSYLLQGKIKKSLELVDEVTGRYHALGKNRMAATIELNKPYILLRFGKYDKALAELDKIKLQAREDDEMTIIVFMAEYYKGVSYLQSNNLKAANRQVMILKDLRDDKNADNRYDLYIKLLEAELALAEGDLDKTIYDLDGDKTLFRTNNPKYHEIKIAYLIDKNKFSEALDILDHMNSQLLSGRYFFGGNQTIYTINLMFRDYYKGIVYEKLNRPKEALVAYDAFLELLKDSDPGIKEKEDAERRVKGLTASASSTSE